MCNICPTKAHWETTRSIVGKLHLFQEATKIFVGSKYPTTNIYFSKICEIKLALSKWLFDSNMTITLMAARMLENFDKYWIVIHGLMGQ